MQAKKQKKKTGINNTRKLKKSKVNQKGGKISNWLNQVLERNKGDDPATFTSVTNNKIVNHR